MREVVVAPDARSSATRYSGGRSRMEEIMAHQGPENRFVLRGLEITPCATTVTD